MADEREVQRLSQLPRTVMAFWKPVAIEGWKDARAMETGTAQALRSTAAGIYATKLDGVADQVLDKVKAAFKGNLLKGGESPSEVEINEVRAGAAERARGQPRSGARASRPGGVKRPQGAAETGGHWS